jgi:hypothetical protein
MIVPNLGTKECSMKTLAALAGTVFMGLIHLGTAEATEISTTYDTSVYTSPNSTVTFDNSGFAGSAGDGEVARDYLMFVMPSVPDTYVASAVLQINFDVAYAYANASYPLSVYATTSDWTASNLTWNNQPGLGASLASFNPTIDGSSITFDLSSYINSQYQATGMASVVIAAAHEFFSVGTPNSWRYLQAGTETLNYTLAPTNVPEPASLVLLATGLIGTTLFRRRTA